MQNVRGQEGTYAVRAAVYLTRHFDSGRRKSHEIAAETLIPRKYLSKILADLVREGLVVSVAGPRGGYELGRLPSEVSLLDVIEAVGGPIQVGPRSGGDRHSKREHVRALPSAWSNLWLLAGETLAELFASTSLAEVAGIDARVETSCARETPGIV